MSKMPFIDGVPVAVFAANSIGTMGAAGDIDVSEHVGIKIDADVVIYFDSASTETYNYVKNTELFFAGISTIHVSAACNYMLM